MKFLDRYAIESLCLGFFLAIVGVGYENTWLTVAGVLLLVTPGIAIIFSDSMRTNDDNQT
jgi:hypothetical protein